MASADSELRASGGRRRTAWWFCLMQSTTSCACHDHRSCASRSCRRATMTARIDRFQHLQPPASASASLAGMRNFIGNVCHGAAPAHRHQRRSLRVPGDQLVLDAEHHVGTIFTAVDVVAAHHSASTRMHIGQPRRRAGPPGTVPDPARGSDRSFARRWCENQAHGVGDEARHDNGPSVSSSASSGEAIRRWRADEPKHPTSLPLSS